MPKYRYRFTISATTDGGLEIDPVAVEDSGELVETTPNIYTILDTARKLIADLERQILLESIGKMFESLTPEEEATPAEVVKEALAKRAEEAVAPEEPQK
jgi:hypothetical protein